MPQENTASTETRRIITRADDLGSFHSANLACLHAYKKGMLRNGGFIVVGGRIDEAAELFRNEKGFCCGLHAALNCEWEDVRWRPVLPPPIQYRVSCGPTGPSTRRPWTCSRTAQSSRT